MSVTIVDLGYGNLGSIRCAFARLGVDVETSSDPQRISASTRLVLPGVGSAGFAMARLQAHGLDQTIRAFTKPVLGICLGMQLLFDWSEEDDTDCLALIRGNVQRLEPEPGRPVPHMGWSRLSVEDSGRGIEDGDYVYFAHSFRCDSSPNSFAQARYGDPIPAAVARDNFLGCQFHPERSGEPGTRFLRAFLEQ